MSTGFALSHDRFYSSRANRSFRPSAIVGWAKIMSRRAEYAGLIIVLVGIQATLMQEPPIIPRSIMTTDRPTGGGHLRRQRLASLTPAHYGEFEMFCSHDISFVAGSK